MTTLFLCAIMKTSANTSCDRRVMYLFNYLVLFVAIESITSDFGCGNVNGAVI